MRLPFINLPVLGRFVPKGINMQTLDSPKMGLAKTFLAIGIAVLFVVFVAYALTVIYPSPSNAFEEYISNHGACNTQYRCTSGSTNDTNCAESRERCLEEKYRQSGLYAHDRNSFYILLAIGLLSVVTGIFLTNLEGIGSGLIGGGILTILWSLIYTWRYWFALGKYVKLIALGIILVVLIYLGYKKLDKKKH